MVNKKVLLLGVIIGIAFALIADEEFVLIEEGDKSRQVSARVFIGIIAFVSASTTALVTFKIIHTKEVWMDFITSISFSVSLTNIAFLSFWPNIEEWINLNF